MLMRALGKEDSTLAGAGRRELEADGEESSILDWGPEAAFGFLRLQEQSLPFVRLYRLRAARFPGRIL
jgi:hypothetical protein